MDLDQDACYRALQTRDPRFDGRFFTAVRSTGIYCRPICPAPTPKRANCMFVACAAAAQEAGFRPCLRCRPESSPGTPAWAGTSTTVARGLRLIEEGALDGGSCEELAARLGIGERHLRRLFVEHVGAPPQAIALTRRVAFAKQLIDESDLKMAEVAFSAGFSSVRRFNDAIRSTYHRSPRELRVARGRSPAGPPHTALEQPSGSRLSLRLSYRPPLDWHGLLSVFQTEAAEGVERVDRDAYVRTFQLEDELDDGADDEGERTVGRMRIRPCEKRHQLVAELELSHSAGLIRIAAQLRRMFDLCADPAEIADTLGRDPFIGRSLRKRPGVRIPGTWDPFELAVKLLVLGPQPGAKDRAALAALVGAVGTRASLAPLGPGGLGGPGGPAAQDEQSRGARSWPSTLFPSPEALAGVEAADLELAANRADAVVALAEGVASGGLALGRAGAEDWAATISQLRALPGIDDATVAQIALRGLGQPDAFSSSDPALTTAFASISGTANLAPGALEQAATHWKPWRGYAVTLLRDSLQ